MKRYDYVKPRSLSEASKVLSELGDKGKAIAGGTGLLPSINQGLVNPAALVDLTGAAELKGIHETDSGELRIGSTTLLHEISSSPVVRNKYPKLAEAARGVASYQIRHRATIGGNVCLDTRCWYYNQSAFWRKSYPDCRKTGGKTCYVVSGGSRCYALMSSDLVPLLVAMDAKLEVFNLGSTRWMQLEDLFTGDGADPIKLKPGDVLTHVILPKPGNSLVGFHKYSIHPPVNFGLTTLAASIAIDPESRVVKDVKLVYGFIDSAPVRCLKTEAFMKGMQVDALGPEEIGLMASKEVVVFSSVNASQGYKKRIIEWQTSELLSRLLCRLWPTEECQQ